MNKLNLKLTEFEINNDEQIELIGLKNYLIALIQN